jgi:raffinose/stachyose/melibiose transport system substrate-binding protein
MLGSPGINHLVKEPTMKTRMTWLAAGAALALSLAGCGASADTSSGGGDGAIEVQTGLAVDSKLMGTLKEIADGFQKSNPDVKLNLIPASTTYEKDMKVRLASGNVPDIWWTHGWSRDRYSKFLMPLQNEAWAKNFNPALAAAMKDKEGAFYALPVDTNIAGIIYNKDVLAAAGVKAEEIKTWDDFGKAAQAVKAQGINPISVSGKANGPAGNLADWIAPGAFSDGELAQLSAGTFVADKYKTVLDLVAQWRDQGFFNPDYASAATTDMDQALAQGKAAFIFSQNNRANNALQYNPKANLGYMPVPSATGGNSYLIGGEYNAYGISKTSQHADGAKKFLAYLAQPENETKLAKSAGSAPGLTDATSDMGALQPSYDQWMTQNKTALVPYFDRVYLPNGMWNTMVTTTDSVITKQSSVEGAVGQVQNDFKSLYGQGK